MCQYTILCGSYLFSFPHITTGQNIAHRQFICIKDGDIKVSISSIQNVRTKLSASTNQAGLSRITITGVKSDEV